MKLLVYIYTNVQLCFNFIFIILVTSFNFETQIICMRSLKLFKMSEILRVATFDTICSFKFATNCVDHSLTTPQTIKVMFINHECQNLGTKSDAPPMKGSCVYM
jgi:hypothetical protein